MSKIGSAIVKITTVREFVGTTGQDGADFLVYPTVHEWDVKDGRAPKGKG